MSDVKTDYSNTVHEQKMKAINDSQMADLIQQGFVRKEKFGSEWEVVDINDVVATIAPGAEPVIIGSKIIYYSLDGTKAVVADISGYLRIQDLSKKTKKRQYLDQYGKEVHNYKDEKGKIKGRSKEEFLRMTHYIIKKRK